MWVKICANTNAKDALRAAELGADAVGFVFAPSKRQVTAAQVRAIGAQLPQTVERVGVFAAGDADEIAATVRYAELQAVQMHGGVDLEAAGRLRQLLPGVEIIHVVHWDLGGSASSATRVREQLRLIEETRLDERVLIDARHEGASGGLGIVFDWKEAAAVIKGFRHLRLIVAGGLRQENVGQAVEALQPFGVDVASGVESDPGNKDEEKVRLFIQAARS